MNLEYKIWFSYSTQNSRRIECWVALHNSQRAMSLQGIATCHKNDQFNKETGRLLALRRIITGLNPNNYPWMTKSMINTLKQQLISAYFSRQLKGTFTL